MERLGFAVVIPMYNEEFIAKHCIQKVSVVLSEISLRHVLIVVEDGSSDGTWDSIKDLPATYPCLTLIKHDHNQGYGAALQTGTNCAIAEGYEYVLYMDSDLTNNPSDIPEFVEKMKDGIDVIKASRFMTNKGMEDIPIKRKIFSILGNHIARLCFRVGVKDCTNGFRAVKTNILKNICLTESGFPVIMEEFYALKFLAKTYCEIPVILKNREKHQRETAFSYRPGILLKYLKFSALAFFCIFPSCIVKK
jgi:dolichol-phosphate mannosyltransferase